MIITYKYIANLDIYTKDFIEKNSIIYQLIWNQLCSYRNYKRREYEQKHNVDDKLKLHFGKELIDLIHHTKTKDFNPEKLNQHRLNIYNSAKNTGLDFGKGFFDKKIENPENFPKNIIKTISKVVSNYKYNNILIPLSKINQKEYNYYMYNPTNTKKANIPEGVDYIAGYNYINKCLKDSNSFLYKEIERLGLRKYITSDTKNNCVNTFGDTEKPKKHDINVFVSYQKPSRDINIRKNLKQKTDKKYLFYFAQDKKKFVEFINDRKEIDTIDQYTKNITITKDSLNNYYICFQLKVPENSDLYMKIKTKHDDSLIHNSIAGIDIGRDYKAVLTDSNNETTLFQNTRRFNGSCSEIYKLTYFCKDCKANKKICDYHLKNHCGNCEACKNKEKVDKLNNKVKKMQRILGRKKKDSNKYKKLNTKIQKINTKRRLRVDMENHVDSLNIVKKYQTIKVEDINLQKSMGRKAQKMNKEGNDKNVNLGKFREYIEYKCSLYGREFIKVDKNNTTQVCNCCGVKSENKIERNIKVWLCSNCGVINDRDINASKNIRDSNNIIIKEKKQNKKKKTVDIGVD